MNRFTSWTYFHIDNNLWSSLNLKGMYFIDLLNSITVGCTEQLKGNDALVSLTIDHVSHEPALLCRLTQICGSLIMGDTYLVALSVFGNQSQTERLPPTIEFSTAQLMQKYLNLRQLSRPPLQSRFSI